MNVYLGVGYLKTIIAGAVAALLAPVLTFAAISIDKAELVLEQALKSDSVIVVNNGDAPAFVEIAAREILNPGQSPEQANRGPDPRAVGLLAAPARLALAPGEQRAIRINTLDSPRDRDRVWRVLAKEVSGPLQAESSGVAVLLGYDILVIQRPSAARVELRVARQGGELTVKNEGNSFAILTDGRQCADGRQACTEIVGARIYAGQTRTLTARDPSAKVEFKLRLPGGAIREVEY